MPSLTFDQSGSFDGFESFLKKGSKLDVTAAFEAAGRAGVAALRAATPVDSSVTSQSWTYKVTRGAGSVTITWYNSNVVAGAPIAIMLQYGHGTGTGGYVQGRDYINPAMKPIFDRISSDVGKAVAGK